MRPFRAIGIRAINHTSPAPPSDSQLKVEVLERRVHGRVSAAEINRIGTDANFRVFVSRWKISVVQVSHLQILELCCIEIVAENPSFFTTPNLAAIFQVVSMVAAPIVDELDEVREYIDIKVL